MAGEEFQPLLRIGPFHKFDTKTAEVYQRDQSGVDSTAIALSNADTARNLGSLMNCFGRNAFQDFPAVSGSITNVLRYDVSPTRPYWLVEDEIGVIYAFDYNNDLISNVPAPSGGVWTQAVQSNGNLFFNNGLQAFLIHNDAYPGNPEQTIETALWQYPPPDPTVYGYGVSKVASANGLAQGTYTYAFAQVIHLPAAGGDIKQTTAVTGGNTPYPYQVTIKKSEAGNTAVQLDGTFSGTTSQGYAFKTAIYRMSSNVPVWYQVAVVDGSLYIDNNTDASISANPQMSFAGQQPPTGIGSDFVGAAALVPIQSHQDRMWVMAIVKNDDTNQQPQTQVWYSNVGQPWNFDATNQVLLLNDEKTNPFQTGSGTIPLPYGQNPVAMASLGSILICWLSNQTWFINGSDETTYQPLQLFPDIGLIAQNGWCVGGGMVAWLSAQGIWTYDGANLTYISNDIYNALQAMPPSQLVNCAAAYADEEFFFSFPVSGSTTGVTWRYYLPTREWTMLPYSSPSFAADTQVGSNPNYLDSFKLNQLIAVRNGTFWLDAWLDGKENDLGQGTVVSWQSPYVDSGMPWVQKDYRWLGISAPRQDVEVTLTLFVDYSNVPSVSNTFNLMEGAGTTQFFPITQDTANGYAASLQVTFQTAVGATAPIEVWSAFVGGTPRREWVIPT